MRQLSGLFVASILLAGVLVAPINFASADNDAEIEEIEEFNQGVVLISSSTTGTGLSEKSIDKFEKEIKKWDKKADKEEKKAIKDFEKADREEQKGKPEKAEEKRQKASDSLAKAEIWRTLADFLRTLLANITPTNVGSPLLDELELKLLELELVLTNDLTSIGWVASEVSDLYKGLDELDKEDRKEAKKLFKEIKKKIKSLLKNSNDYDKKSIEKDLKKVEIKKTDKDSKKDKDKKKDKDSKKKDKK